MSNEDILFDISHLDEKRKRLQTILQHDDDDAVATEKQSLEMGALNNQQQRIDIARKLNEYNKNKAKREEEWKKLEEDLLEYKKRDMIENILNKKRYQMDTKDQISKLESEQVQLLAQLDLIKEEAMHRQADIEATKVEWEKKFQPVIDLNLVPAASETVHSALSKYDRNINDAVTKELQRSLYELFIQTSQRLAKEREELKLERNRLEEMLQENLQRLKFESSISVDDDLDATLEVAKNMQSIVQMKLEELQSRMNEIREEETWLLSEPNNASWKRITERIAETNRNRVQLQRSTDDSQHYVSFKKTKNDAKTAEAMIELKNSMANIMFVALLDEVTELMVEEVARDMISLRQIISKRVTNIFVEAASRTTQDDMASLHNTGAAFLLQGCFADMARSYQKYDRFHYRHTQPVINASQPTPRKFRMPKQSLHRVISLRDSILTFDDGLHRRKLERYELQCWKKVLLTSCGASPLIVPEELSRLRVLKALAQMSLVFCGAKNGRIAIWSVPWAGGSSAYVGLTPMLPLGEIADVEDIIDNPLPGNQFLSVDSKGIIRIWVMNPVTTRKSHTGRMFPKTDSAFAPNIPSCIYYITLTEYNISGTPNFMPSVQNDFGRQKKKKKRIDYLGLAKAQKGTQPTSVCFFSQFAITGRAPALLVGTAGGRIFKLNADFKESTFETKVAYSPCIPKVEWMNPASLVKDESGVPHSMVVAAHEPDKKGNKVYRELFHYHKDQIIFLGALNNISNRIVSLDAVGKAALWAYDEDYFIGRCSFTPMSTATLDLRWLVMSLDPSVRPPNVTQPTPQVLRELKIMRRNKLPDGQIVLSFQPHTIDNTQMLYECKFVPRDNQLNVDNDWREDIENALKTQWTANAVQTTIIPTTVHGAHMTVDSEELVFMLSYDKLTLGLKKKIAKFTYNRQDTNNKNDVEARSKVAIIICLSLNNLEVHRPVAVFEIAPQDVLLSISIGPVLGDTLSRMAFVQTDKQIRVFSLETGQELISDTFPFMPSKTLPKFRPLMSAFCPLQKMAVFGSSDDARLSVQMFSSSGKTFDDIPLKALDGFTRSVDHLRKLVYQPFDVVRDEQPLPPPSNKWLLKYIAAVIEECLEGVDEFIDMEYRKDIIYKLFGNSKLGVIEPTQWPAPFQRSCSEDEESEESSESSEDSSEEESDESGVESSVAEPIELMKSELKSDPEDDGVNESSDSEASKNTDRSNSSITEKVERSELVGSTQENDDTSASKSSKEESKFNADTDDKHDSSAEA